MNLLHALENRARVVRGAPLGPPRPSLLPTRPWYGGLTVPRSKDDKSQPQPPEEAFARFKALAKPVLSVPSWRRSGRLAPWLHTGTAGRVSMRRESAHLAAAVTLLGGSS